MSENKPSVDEVLFDGREIEIALPGGGTGFVKVSKVPRARMVEYASLVLQEVEESDEKEISVYTARPRDWIDSLPEASFDAILKTGRELNTPFFETWLRRKAARETRRLQIMERLPEVTEAGLKILEAQERLTPPAPTSGS